MADRDRAGGRRPVGAALALAVLTAPLGAQTGHVNQAPTHSQPQTAGKAEHALSGPPVRLLLRFKAGDANRYRMTAQVEAQLPGAAGQPATPAYSVSVDLLEKEEVSQALPNGNGELAVSTVSGQGVLNGQAFLPRISEHPARITFTATGDLVSAKDLPADDADVPVFSNMFGSGAFSMHGVFLPALPVRIGDTWVKSVKVAGLAGNSIATVRSSLVRLEEVGRYKTARIHSVLQAPIRAWIDASSLPTTQPQAAVSELHGTLTITYDTNLAVTEGKVVRAAGNGKVDVTILPMNADTEKVASTAHSHTSPPTPQTRMVMLLHLGTELQD